MKILAASNYYVPGFRGGTIRALASIVERLGDRHDFSVVTTDRDVRQPAPHAGITVDAWQTVGRARVFYGAPGALTLARLRAIVDEVAPDLLLLFSAFSTISIKFVTLRRLGRIAPVPVVVAPAGEFSPETLAVRGLKKRTFLATAAATGLYTGVHWKAASARELQQIRDVVGAEAAIHLAAELPPVLPGPADRAPAGIAKQRGELKLVCLGRVMRHKNVGFLIDRLPALRGDVELDVIGPVEDEAYAADCRARAAALPENLRVRFPGDVPHERIFAEIAAHHAMALPTLGENYGYVCLEALACGRPIVISDATPWRDLERRHAGWDLALSDPSGWERALQQLVDMDDDAFQAMVSSAWLAGRELAAADETVEAVERMFERASATRD